MHVTMEFYALLVGMQYVPCLLVNLWPCSVRRCCNSIAVLLLVVSERTQLHDHICGTMVRQA